MNSFGWQNAWQRTYNNASDEKWKTKSLNPTGNQTYQVKLPSAKRRVGGNGIKLEGSAKQQKQKQRLPSPNMTKINETMFVITLENQINLFYLPNSIKKKQGKTFRKTQFKLQENIIKVIGLTTPQGDNFFVVATKDSLILLKIINEKGEYTIRKMEQKVSVPDFRIHLCFGTYRVIAMSLTHIYEFQLENGRLKQIITKKIQFSSKDDQQRFKNLSPIALVTGYGKNFYFFGSKQDKRLDTNKIKGIEDATKPDECEALTIVKLKVTGKNDIEGISAEIFPIDYIFELGMFNRTKIYEIQQDTFLFSLHEEIILLRKHFNKYIVWDNVSVVSSKSQSKKGQLILLAQTILAYSEPLQIFVHQIFFQQDQQSKLKMPTIDNFKGSENQQLVLYDALMLSTQESVMKVLVYVKQVDVIYPANKDIFRNIQDFKGKQAPTTLQFTLICINQNDPKKKLESLILLNKRFGKPTTQEVKDFCERFSISDQDYTKCKWNVSDKKQKDIQDVLMLIKDDEFIKIQLDNILKQQSHQLSFLSIVEAKQIGRLKDILSQKVNQYVQINLNYIQKSLSQDTEKQYIFGIMKWLMESEMFAKKIAYSRQFLTFKEYDFIEIGKLRAASLKQQIKLLSQKKFVKRLKYFINQFKNLVVANFQEVFSFLLIGKSVPEIQKFIRQFPFILPKFKQDSQVFIERKQHMIIKRQNNTKLDKRSRLLSFCEKNLDVLPIPSIKIHNERSKSREKSQELSQKKSNADQKQKMKQSFFDQKAINDTRCLLWGQDDEQKLGEDQSRPDYQKIPQTLQVFLQNRLDDIRKSAGEVDIKEKAMQLFPVLLKQFTNDNWFKIAAFKQHCMITKTSKQILKEFEDLKKGKSFLILVKFLYGQLDNLEKKNKSSNGQVQKMRKQIQDLLTQFIQEDLVPESFVRNVQARIKVYQLLRPLAKRSHDKKTVSIQLPKFQEFLIKSQPQYFAEIFEHLRKKIFSEVKNIYDKIQVGFFKQRFGKYLQSDRITPREAIEFLDDFTQGSNDDIRKDIFNAIIRLLKLDDRQNTRRYIMNSLDKSILPEEQIQAADKLRDQAKIPYGSYFFNLFVAFKINYTYEQLISFTRQANIKNNKIIIQLVQKYCKEEYKLEQDSYDQTKKVCKIEFEDFGVNLGIIQKIEKIDIHNQPLEFFGLLMIFLFNLDFNIMDYELFQLLMQNYLNLKKFNQLTDFIRKLKNYHISEDNMNTKNYQMIRDFKEENDLSQIFIQYTLNWIKRNYDDIRDVTDLQEKLDAIQKALEMVQKFHKNIPDIRKERAFYSLLTKLQQFSPQVITNIQYIKGQVMSNSGFIFLMHMFKKIGHQKLKNCNQKNPDTVQNFYLIFQYHQEYLKNEKVDYYHPQFIRFLIEFCLKMIQSNQFEMAKYLILYKIPNDNQYFMDVILIFLAAASSVQLNNSFNNSEFYRAIKKQILQPETTSLIRNNLERLIKEYNIMGFIPLKHKSVDVSGLVAKTASQVISKETETNSEENSEFYQRCVSIFKLTLQKYRKDDAFFFLVRAKIVKNSSLARLAQQSLNNNLFKEQQQTRLKAHFLVTSYLKNLERFIQKQFYPTYRFFESKILMLTDAKTRIDVIKDINIAMSKLQRLCFKDQKNTELYYLKHQLQNQYEQFMKAIGEDPDIKLVDSQSKGATATLRAEVYARSKNIAKQEEQMKKQINQHKKVIQQNINKTHQIQEQSRFNILNREVSENIAQIRKANERHAALQANIKKQKEGKQVNIAEKKTKQLQEIKKKQKQDIQSIKDSYKSNTTKRVNDLIESLRKKRQQIKQKTYAPTSAVREEHNPYANMKDSKKFLNVGDRANLIKPPVSPKREDQFLPISNKVNKFQNIQQQQGKNRNKFLQLQKKVMNSQAPQPFEVNKNKLKFQDIAKIYREKQSQEALKCIQKYDMLKNVAVRGELIKRAYAVTNNLESFLHFCKFVIDSDPTWKQSIEEKSIPIALQMLKMEPKQKITIKQIIPVEFFTKVVKMNLKDYYGVAFDIFKPKIVKILQKDLMAVQAIGILFRYALGSETRFYNKVFYEYFNVILNSYEIKNYDDKQLTTLAQKIRSNYSYLPDNKTEILEKLLQKITNPQKKMRLLQGLMKVIERKGESLVGGNSNKEIAFVVQKLMKM